MGQGNISRYLGGTRDIIKEASDFAGDSKREFRELMTEGFFEMVIKDNNDYKTSVEMEREAKQYKREKAEYGDIIAVSRWGGVYDHYGVYIGEDSVIHYAGRDGDFQHPIIHIALYCIFKWVKNLLYS